ncbi:MAG TPA: hypothetical protein VLK65_21355 [Vicinamibacteria bacterium]|nr:hypothetical protein [Vicinamibacteria bacterium]
MNKSKIQISDMKFGTRYIWATRYEIENDPESNGAIGCRKNFPTAFMLREELRKSSLEE